MQRKDTRAGDPNITRSRQQRKRKQNKIENKVKKKCKK